jgi:hypothetical protein
MKNSDDIFSRKVKEAFDSYDADHLAEEGWNSFVRKQGRRRTRAIIIPLWARAASIIIMVTAGALFLHRLSQPDTGENTGRVAQESGNRKADTELTGKEPARDASGNSGTRSSVTAETADNTAATTMTAGAASGISAPATQSAGARSEVTSASARLTEQGSATNAVTTVAMDPVRTPEATGRQAGRQLKSDIEKTGSNAGETAGPILAETAVTGESLTARTLIASGMSAGIGLPDTPVEIRLTDDADARLNLKPRKQPGEYLVIPREKMTTTIMTGLSGMMASVENTTFTSQGVSIGFYVEQQLTRRISVRPGLAMAKYNYAVGNTPGGSASFDYAAPELDGMPAASTSYDADMDIVSMEVPVNFVFSLRKRSRSNLFVTTGASTVIYLSQHLTGSFNNTYTRTTVDSYSGNVIYETMTTSMQIESEQELFNRVDFLGLANFSAGYSMPFRKTSHLLLEPFVQLPIKDLTSMNLRIRYGGLSMKIQF